MPAIKGLEWTFDTVASTYEKMRPGYVEELYRTIFDYIPIGENSNVYPLTMVRGVIGPNRIVKDMNNIVEKGDR